MNISGAEAVVAAASPFFGQAESPCLVRPYVDLMTPSELHLTIVSGDFSRQLYLCVFQIIVYDFRLDRHRNDCCFIIHGLYKVGCPCNVRAPCVWWYGVNIHQ